MGTDCSHTTADHARQLKKCVHGSRSKKVKQIHHSTQPPAVAEFVVVWIHFYNDFGLKRRLLKVWLKNKLNWHFAAYLNKLWTHDISRDVGCVPRTNLLDFGGDLDHDPDADGFRWYIWQVDNTQQVLVTHFVWGQKVKCHGRRDFPLFRVAASRLVLCIFVQW